MIETEKMRAILRERGIEYRDVNSMVTDIEHDGIKTRVYDYDDGPDYQLCVEQKWLTAEEAVRVALGINPQEVLERRIDELCAEVEALKRDEWAAGFSAACDAIEAADEGGRPYYEVENAKLRESLERAAGIIADICGECPVSRYEWLSSDSCDEKCGTVTYEECWIAYLTGKRWDESGAEVDR